MKIRSDYKSCLVLSVVFASVGVGLGQDAPQTPALKILETASRLASEGRLKDALRIVSFVQATPGLTDRESAECYLLLAEFEALAIKFYGSKGLNQQAPEHRVEADVGAMRLGARLVALGNELSVNALDVSAMNVERPVELRPEQYGIQLKPFEWVPVNERELRIDEVVEDRVAESQSTAESPRVLPPGSGLRAVFDEASSVRHSPQFLPGRGRLFGGEEISVVEDGFTHVGSDGPSGVPAFPAPLAIPADFDFAEPLVKCSHDAQPKMINSGSIIDLKWVVLVAGVMLGSLPAVAVRLAGLARERFRSKVADRDHESGRFEQPIRTDRSTPPRNLRHDSDRPSVARVDSIFSQIVQENQRIQA